VNKNKKIILVTGASDGIGRAIAVKLAADGHKIIVCGRDQERLKSVAKECGENTTILNFDINDLAAQVQAIRQLERLDVLINNAGVWQKLGDLDSISEKSIMSIINTNLTSQIVLTKKLLPFIKESNGAIINVISKSGIEAQEGQAAYTASKYGMRGFTDVLRQDLKKHNVRVGAVYQSGTNTEMFRKAGDDLPVSSFTEPTDLADLIAYMLNSPKKMWINEVRVEK
jgi:NADP-dependent 3-hydroxy acid dehydrogenase YdfG